MKTIIQAGQHLHDFLYKNYGDDSDYIENQFLKINRHVYFLVAPTDTPVHPICMVQKTETVTEQFVWD